MFIRVQNSRRFFLAFKVLNVLPSIKNRAEFNVLRSLTRVGALVYFQILRPGEHFAASLERARERFLAGVHPDVVDQLVLGLERPALALATVPEARVRRALGPADVLDGDV